MKIFDSYELILASAVADAGTFTLTYKVDRDSGSFASSGHVLIAMGATLKHPDDFTVAFGATSITVTNASGVTWPAGTTVFVELNRGGEADADDAGTDRNRSAATRWINLGAPDAADPDGVCLPQSATGAHSLTLNGALVGADGVAVLDVPRNVVVDSGGADTATLTVNGFDEYGVAMSENIVLNGTTAVAGKKAFKRITAVTASGTITNAAFIGTGDVLGLPVFIAGAAEILRESQNGAVATAGTLVTGDVSEATATSGDVRGTYDPSAACNGSLAFDILVAPIDPDFKGVTQFSA